MADEAYPIPGTNQITDLVLWESFFSAVQLDGVVYGIEPSLNSGARTVVITDGAMYVRGFYKPVHAARSTPIPAASAQNRIDRLVMRLDRSQATSAPDFVKPVVLQGTPGSNTPPALTRVISPTGIWDTPICRWTSQSNGALSGLTKERYYLEGSFEAGARTGGLLPATPPRVGIERETGDVYRSDGTAWQSMWQDTGEIALTPASGWTVDGTFWGRRTGGICEIDVNLSRSGGTVTEGTESRLATLPTSLRPAGRNRFFFAHITSDNNARLDVQTDGEIWLRHLFADIPRGEIIRATVTYIQGG